MAVGAPAGPLAARARAWRATLSGRLEFACHERGSHWASCPVSASNQPENRPRPPAVTAAVPVAVDGAADGAAAAGSGLRARVRVRVRVRDRRDALSRG
jgi:hypothetical protein